MNNIARFRACVTMISFIACFAHGAETEENKAFIRFFFAGGSAVQTAKIENAPALPQLRRSIEAGTAFFPNDILRTAFSVEAFLVDPSIPAGLVLHRGYSGFALKGSFDIGPNEARGESPSPFVSFGVSAAIARYASTDLAFAAYSLFAAAGLVHSAGDLTLRVGIPLTVEFRGDATAVSAGINFGLSRVRAFRREAKK